MTRRAAPPISRCQAALARSVRTDYYHHQSCTGVVGAQPPLVHALPPTITPPSPTRSHPLHSPTTLPHQTSTRPPLTAPFHQPRIVFLHYKPTSGLNFFLHRLGLRRCGGGGSAAHCFDAQPRTLLFCRHHSSITPRCNRAPGHITRRRLARERAFTVVSPKKIAKITAPPDRGQGALSNPRSFRYRQTHTTTTRSNLDLGRPHYGIERFNWRTVPGQSLRAESYSHHHHSAHAQQQANPLRR